MDAGTDDDLAMNAAEVAGFLAEVFPQLGRDGGAFTVDSVRRLGARVRLSADERHLRPGGTVSGPNMMALADYAAYVAILAQIGRVPLAVTTNLSINFLRKPGPGDLVGDCTLIKLGKRLAVAEVEIGPAGGGAMVAHAVVTYSIPTGAQK